MTLSDLAAFGSFVSGLAVLVSLVFLYFQLRQVTAQVRQAEKNQRASISVARHSRIIDSSLATTEPSVADANSLGMAADTNITDTQIRQFFANCLARFFNAQDSFYQHRHGLLEDYEFINMTKGFEQSMMSPGFRVAYKRARGIYGDEFVAYLDDILNKTPIKLSDDFAGSFRADLVSERALAGGVQARSAGA